MAAQQATFSFHTATIAALAAAFALAAPESRAQGAASPFEGLSGSWSGNGTVALANGTSERIRCRATYAVGGSGRNLQQDLRCASDSYRIDLQSNVTYEGGAISGTWSESTRNVAGNIAGRASAGQIQARADSPGFSASLGVVTQGNRQTVTIRAPGTQVEEVSIALQKGSR